jgi:hypothetical protein
VCLVSPCPAPGKGLSCELQCMWHSLWPATFPLAERGHVSHLGHGLQWGRGGQAAADEVPRAQGMARLRGNAPIDAHLLPPRASTQRSAYCYQDASLASMSRVMSWNRRRSEPTRYFRENTPDIFGPKCVRSTKEERIESECASKC